MSRIVIDVEYYRNKDYGLTAELHCNPMTVKEMKDGREDEIVISFLKLNEEALNLTLTQEQCREFIWALQKMITIADEYRQR
jgi:hypothetical protein